MMKTFIMILYIFFLGLVSQTVFASDIHKAAKGGDLEAIKAIIEKGPDKINEPNSEGLAPLHLAAFYGHVEIVNYLIDNGAKIDIRTCAENSSWNTPFHFAAEQGYLQIIKIFLDKGTNINVLNRWGENALHRIAYLNDYSVNFRRTNSYEEIVEFLIKKGIHINATNSSGLTPLQAAKLNNIKIIKVLQKYGANG
ncbi:MAG: ankyrin repeat domain-containing protein [Vulcanimicrobiota bacterium]